MLGITDLSTYVVGKILIVLLPGPNSLNVLSVAARRGVKDGYAAAAAVWTGDAVLMVLSAAGVASLLQTNDTVFAIVKWAGAGYLAFLAYGMIRTAIGMWASRREAQAAVVEGVELAGPVERPYRRALVISLLNPKAILFFVAFFVQFVDPAYAHPELSFLLLGALLQIASVIYLSVLIFAGTRLAELFRRRRAMAAGATSTVAAVFLAFAVKLSISHA